MNFVRSQGEASVSSISYKENLKNFARQTVRTDHTHFLRGIQALLASFISDRFFNSLNSFGGEPEFFARFPRIHF